MNQHIYRALTPRQVQEFKEELLAVEHGYYKLMPSRCEHGIMMDDDCEECHLEYTNDPS